MKKLLCAGLLSLVSGWCNAATIVTLDGNALFTTMPTVEFDTDQNLLRIDSNENLTCSGGTGATPGPSILTVRVDSNPVFELQSEITIERVNDDTLVSVVTVGNDIVCTFVDEILIDGFEDQVVLGQPPITQPRPGQPRPGLNTRG